MNRNLSHYLTKATNKEKNPKHATMMRRLFSRALSHKTPSTAHDVSLFELIESLKDMDDDTSILVLEKFPCEESTTGDVPKAVNITGIFDSEGRRLLRHIFNCGTRSPETSGDHCKAQAQNAKLFLFPRFNTSPNHIQPLVDLGR